MYINTGTDLNASQSKLYVVFTFQKVIAVEILFFKNCMYYLLNSLFSSGLEMNLKVFLNKLQKMLIYILRMYIKSRFINPYLVLCLLL